MTDPTAPLQPCTIHQAEALLRHHLETLWRRPGDADLLPPLMLWGPPGVGKSAMVRDLTRELGIGFLDVRLSQREPVDIRGLPVPGEDGVHWLLSAEWPRDEASRGVILFDELTAADRSLQAAAYEFILDRRLGDLYRVPKGWYIAAAGNRIGDRAIAATLSSALANRFCHLSVEPDLDAWTTWARRARLHPLVSGFLRFRPACFFDMAGDLERGWPSPRSWERVAVELEAAEERGLEPELLRLVISGLVGPGAGAEFWAYRSFAIDLPDVGGMLDGRVGVTVPDRADQRYAFCAALVHHLFAGDADPDRTGRFHEIVASMPNDFAMLTMTDAVQSATDRDADAARALFEHPRFADFASTHGAELASLLARTGPGRDE